MLSSFGALTKNAKVIAVEVVDYSKKSIEDSAAEATKLNELYVELAKAAYKPFEGVLAKVVTK